MRKLLMIAALSLGLTASATTANARASWGDDLRYVADTKIPGTNGPMSLCHLVSFMDVLFVPVYTRINGYAVSDNSCSGEAYRDITADQFRSLQANGLIPQDLSATPQVAIGSLAWGHAWLILAAIGILKTIFIAATRRQTRKAGTPDMLTVHSLIAMSQVAFADGQVDTSEVQQIANILTRLTGKPYAPQQVSDLLVTLNPFASDIAQIGQDLSPKDRQIVLEAALNIAVADGEIHPDEYAVIADLAERMQIGADQFRSALASISAHLKTMKPA